MECETLLWPLIGNGGKAWLEDGYQEGLLVDCVTVGEGCVDKQLLHCG
jgi:hypothetical protein